MKPMPRLVLCDYMLGSRSGLDLLQSARVPQESDNSVFILVTGNTSQGAVARAAEEDVDSFILKPYTLETLKSGLVNAVITKIFPSEYIKTIRKGKEELFSGNLDQSIKTFEEAIKLDNSPTLAHFYRGYAQKMKNTVAEAEGSFAEGLSLNKIHYKCLIGLFDLLMEQKRSAEAYEVVKRVAQYFPANPKRLASVLRLAIITQHYEDMEGYYRLFTQMEQRTDELVNYMCSALIVVGKHYLSSKHRQRAVEVFEKAAVSSAGQIKFLKYIIEALIEFDCHEQAVPFFKRYQNNDRTSPVFKSLDFLVFFKKEELSTTLSKGQALLRSGVKDPLVYRYMIECCAKAGLNDVAQDITGTAGREFPGKQKEFDSVLGAFLKEKTAVASGSEKGRA
jgi:tetratricopeptide (TPR) repeat protein